MTRGPDDSRRYSEREMAVILKLAAELERRSPVGGHSLAEIQEIAAEAGIEPHLVRQAAAALTAQRSSKLSAFLGAPTSYHVQRHVEGEPSQNKLSDLVGTIRRAMRREGQVSQVLGSLEWRFVNEEGASGHVEISSQQGGTRIRVTGRFGNYAGWLYLVAGVAAAVASVVAGHEIHAALPVEIGIISGIWGTAYVGARTAWQRIGAATERRLRSLADELVAEIAGGSEKGSPTRERAPASLPGSPRVD